ncbi:apolipoprotein N-acyltransferase [Amycolatopsis ultiminotia]|uniref:Apolipoprotein N-acyltransferase n=1 Tax=Amycolatopsis ultiminotia TaxID=543629 RepID=A0ABP6W1H0_9PSEU
MATTAVRPSEPAPGRAGRCLGWTLAATVVSGVLFHFGLGFEPVAVLAWIAPLPVLLLAPRVGGWVASAAAFLGYFAGSAGSWSYFLNSLTIPLPGALAILIGAPLLFAATVAFFRRLVRVGRPILATVATPALWTGVLYGVSLLSPVGVMGTFMTSQADHPDVLRIASVSGGWGIEYLVLLAPVAFAAAFAPGRRASANSATPQPAPHASAQPAGSPPAPRGVRTSARAGILVVTAAAAGGALMWGAAAPSGSANHVRIAVLARSQPHWAADPATGAGRQVLESYVDALAVLPPDVRIAVLPEGAFGSDRARLANITGPLSDLARAKRLHIVTGTIVQDPGRTYNTALDVPPTGPIVEYHKWRTGTSPVTAGNDLAFLPGQHIGLEVCMDVNGSSPTSDYAPAGAGLILIPASDEDVDGWQHSRTAVLRGVENGVSVAWSATRGAPTLSDATGHVLADTRTGSTPMATATADVPLGTGDTPYRHLHDWFAWLCGLTALPGLFLTRK